MTWEQTATVKEKIAPRSYIVKTKDDKVQYRRNRKHLRKITAKDEDGSENKASSS